MSEPARIDPDAIPHDMEDRRVMAEQMAEAAQAAFSAGDVQRATALACDLLMLFPNERRYLDLFDEVVLSVDDPLELVQVDRGDVRVATAAGRARVLMMARRLPEALQILTRAVDLAPQVPYLHWVLRWLQPQILQGLDPTLVGSTVVHTAVELALAVPVPPWRHDRRLPNLRAGAETLAAIRSVFPDDPTLYWGEAEIRRRLKESDQALPLIENAVANYPEDHLVRAAAAHVLADLGRVDEAVEHARQAIACSPEVPPSVTPLYDVAWAFIEHERFAEAEQILTELDGRAEHPGARACLHYARFRATGAEDAREALLRLREQDVEDAKARELADEVDPPVPYVNVLPSPADAGTEALRAYVRELETLKPMGVLDGPVSVTLRSRYLESPSLGVAFEAAARRLGTIGALAFEIEALQEPDPRGDKAQVSTPIWRWDGLVAHEVYSDGDADAQAAITGIARMPFHRDTWLAAAQQVAARFGNEGLHPMLSVLTHPPPVPDEHEPVTWTWRAQVATAAVVAHLGGWEGGAARAGIYSMLYGPSDWVTAAAIVAMAWRATQVPAIEEEAVKTFAWMRTILPEKGVSAWEGPLVDAWRMLAHDGETAMDLAAWSQRHHAERAEADAVQPIERGYGGLSLQKYAEFAAARDRIVTETGIPTVGAGRASIPEPPPKLATLCNDYGVPLRHPGTFAIHPYVDFWEAAFAASPALEAHFLQMKRRAALGHLGVDLDREETSQVLREGRELRERLGGEGSDGDAAADEDPVMFPGEPLEKLSDWVAILKEIQRNGMPETLAKRGLDQSSYALIAQKWSGALNHDPALAQRYHTLMDS